MERETSAFDELAAALAAAKSDQERAALLAKEKELVTAELAHALGNQGDHFYDQGDYRQALAVHRLAKTIAEQIGDQPGIARTPYNIGNLHFSQGDYAQALEYYQKCLKLYVGAEACEDRAKTEAAKASILHFATHGILNNASPMYSHLVLAQGDKNEDGLLEAWELLKNPETTYPFYWAGFVLVGNGF